MRNSHALSSNLSVGPEPSLDELKSLAAAGFNSIINNRPDGEDGAGMTSDEWKAASTALGLDYVHIPVEGRNPLEGSVREFSEELEELRAPVYAFCKTGGRSAALWALASVSQFDNATLVQKCADGMHDISMLEPKLTSRRALLEDEDD